MFRSSKPAPVIGLAYEQKLSESVSAREQIYGLAYEQQVSEEVVEDIGGMKSLRKDAAVKTVLAVLNEKFFTKMLRELENNVKDHTNSLEERYQRLKIPIRVDGSASRIKQAKRDRLKLMSAYKKSQGDLAKNKKDLEAVRSRLEQFHSKFGKYKADIGMLMERAETAEQSFGSLWE